MACNERDLLGTAMRLVPNLWPVLARRHAAPRRLHLQRECGLVLMSGRAPGFRTTQAVFKTGIEGRVRHLGMRGVATS